MVKPARFLAAAALERLNARSVFEPPTQAFTEKEPLLALMTAMLPSLR
jgi:hypothetical protein